jgi:hypothetical protein
LPGTMYRAPTTAKAGVRQYVEAVVLRTSKKGPSTACPGASRKTKGAGHSTPFLRQGRMTALGWALDGDQCVRKSSPREGGVSYIKKLNAPSGN